MWQTDFIIMSSYLVKLIDFFVLVFKLHSHILFPAAIYNILTIILHKCVVHTTRHLFNIIVSIFSETSSILVEGYCSEIAAGTHDIRLRVEECAESGTYRYSVKTGTNGVAQRLIIEEIRMQTNIVGGKLRTLIIR